MSVGCLAPLPECIHYNGNICYKKPQKHLNYNGKATIIIAIYIQSLSVNIIILTKKQRLKCCCLVLQVDIMFAIREESRILYNTFTVHLCFIQKREFFYRSNWRYMDSNWDRTVGTARFDGVLFITCRTYMITPITSVWPKHPKGLLCCWILIVSILSCVSRFKVCVPFLFLESVFLLGKGGNTGQVGWLSVCGYINMM